MSIFARYARCYELLYRDKDYVGEAQYVDALVKSRNPNASRLLDLGCGTGAHARGFAALGYTVTGVDASADMLAAARYFTIERPGGGILEPEFMQGDARTVRLGFKVDVVTALFHVMSYQVTNADLAAVCSTAAAHLERGGLFVFDFWYGPAVLTSPPELRVRRLRDGGTQLVRIAQPTMHANENRVDVTYTMLQWEQGGAVDEFTEHHAMRYLFLPELSLVLEAHGFALEAAYAWLSTQGPTALDWNAVVVARRA